MTLMLDLPKELEAALVAEAQKEGLTLEDYALQLLERRGFPVIESGAALVAYWRSIGVIGSRPDIADSAAQARMLREVAENRYADE